MSSLDCHRKSRKYHDPYHSLLYKLQLGRRECLVRLPWHIVGTQPFKRCPSGGRGNLSTTLQLLGTLGQLGQITHCWAGPALAAPPGGLKDLSPFAVDTTVVNGASGHLAFAECLAKGTMAKGYSCVFSP